MALLIAIIAALLVLPAQAQAFQLVLHDQGADPAVLVGTAGLLGITTARIVVRADDPKADLVRAYRRAGLRVQGAIIVKRWTTAGDIRSVLRAWDGDVRTVSIGNEPELNGVHACPYVRLYRRAYRLIRKEFPGIKIGIGEHAPHETLKYVNEMLACRGPRIRADFFAIHPYQAEDDPMSPDRYGTWYYGIGNLGTIKRYLNKRSTRQRLSRPNGSALPIYVTEFTYFSDGEQAISSARAVIWWPRAIQQAKRYADQLVIYGLGAVGPDSRWRSASLLDEHGRRLPAFDALAASLGRTLPPEEGNGGELSNVTAPPVDGGLVRDRAWEADPAPSEENSSGLDERPMDTTVPVVEGAPQ